MSEPSSRESATMGRDTGLVRALGVREIAFNTVNLVVGASIFVLPADPKLMWPSGIVAYVVCAITIGFVALCFAEAGSRVSATGGVYAYAETAFGPFVGYLTGVITWFGSFMIGGAAVAVALVNSIGVLIPAAAGTVVHNTLLIAIYVTLAAVNIRGVQTGARFVEWLTIVKLAPLFLLIGVGVFYVDPSNLAWAPTPTAHQIADGSLLLIFAFLGMEAAVTPGGEIRDPARTVPRSILFALLLITVLYIAIQVVAQGVLGPALQQNPDAPLAAAAAKTMGSAGRLMLLAAAIVSAFGYLAGDMLTSPRLLYAFGRDGHLPGVFARVHERFRTPHVAIAVHTAAALAFALSSTFGKLVIMATVCTLLIYGICAVSVIAMRMKGIRTSAEPFVIPGGPVVPLLACAVVVGLLSRATRTEYTAVAITLAVALVPYGAVWLVRRQRAPAT